MDNSPPRSPSLQTTNQLLHSLTQPPTTKMVSFTSIITAAVAATGALAAPATDLATRAPTGLSARGGTPSSAGMNNGCYYSWWTDNGAQATYTNGAKGQYSVNWQSGGNLVGGKGWKTGSPRYVPPTPNSRIKTNQFTAPSPTLDPTSTTATRTLPSTDGPVTLSSSTTSLRTSAPTTPPPRLRSRVALLLMARPTRLQPRREQMRLALT